MTDLTSILAGLGPAERLALVTRKATQQTADKLAGKKLTRYIQGPPRRAYAKTVKLTIELTALGEEVVRSLESVEAEAQA